MIRRSLLTLALAVAAGLAGTGAGCGVDGSDSNGGPGAGAGSSEGDSGASGITDGGSGGSDASASSDGSMSSTGGSGDAGSAADGAAMHDGSVSDAAPATDSGARDASTDAGDLKAAASALDGFAILKPCPANFRPSGNPNDATTCEETADTENQHITKQFGGDPNVTYNVKIRIAGASERYWYSGGTLDAVSKLFYTGGLPTIHGPAPNDNLAPGDGACKIHPPETDNRYRLPFTVPTEIRPSDGCYNGFNIFAMTVSSPKQSYYLNFTTDFDGGDRQPHKTYMADYTVTIPISGQAMVQFYTIDGDHHQVANNGNLRVSNVKTPQPYTGNFLELTVVDVTRAN